jgi:sigma-E factor negative regulatory protein RseC
VLTETGRVVACDEDALWVETIRRSTCGSCSANKACGHSLINSVTDGKRSFIRVLPGKLSVDQCKVDDQVRISIPEEVLLRGSFVAYMVPLLAMLAGAMLGVRFAGLGEDAGAALGAVAGLAAGFALVRWHALRHRTDTTYQPILLEVLGPSPAIVVER